MGANMSATRSGEKITRNRIREVCQVDPSVTEELRDFRIELLANDMSSIGYLVPVMDKNGKSLSSTAICARISEAIPPPVESMCMIGNKGSNKGIYKLVDMFNVNYGANIPIKNINGKNRPVEDLCDDLYLVSERVHRQLDGDAVKVKQALNKHIEELKEEHAMLSALFAKHLGSLHEGDLYDGINHKISEIKNHQKTILQNIDEELTGYQKQADQLNREYDENIKKSSATLTKDLSDYATMSVLNLIPGIGDTSVINKVGKVLDIATASGAHAGQCSTCIKNVFGSLEQYSSALTNGTYREKIQEYASLASKSGKTDADMVAILNCVKMLHSMRCQGSNASPVDNKEELRKLLNSLP